MNRRSVAALVYCVELIQWGGGIVKGVLSIDCFEDGNAIDTVQPFIPCRSGTAPGAAFRWLCRHKTQIARRAVTGNDGNVQQSCAGRDVQDKRFFETFFYLLSAIRRTSSDSALRLLARVRSSGAPTPPHPSDKARSGKFWFSREHARVRVGREGLKAHVVIRACDA